MDVSELTAVIRRSHELLSGTTNVGMTGEMDDLYTIVDFLSYAFGQTYPTLPCKAGCSHCCEEMPFRVRALEWETIRRHLETVLSPEALVDFKAKVRDVYGSYRPQLEGLSTFWSSTELGAPGVPLDGLPTRCPFLSAEGTCGIYEVRPMVCRSYGNFGVTLQGKPTMLICKTYGPGFIDGLAESGAESLAMPPIEPFYQRLAELSGGDETIAPLQLWVLNWAEA